MFWFLAFLYMCVGLYFGYKYDQDKELKPSNGPLFLLTFLTWPAVLLFRLYAPKDK